MAIHHYKLRGDGDRHAGPAKSPPPRSKSETLNDAQCLLLEGLQRKFDDRRNELTPWAESFLGNLLDRFRRYGDRTMISAKQWGIIDEIREKLA
jgi:hypothetical protein